MTTSQPFSLSLSTGWNQIGDPFLSVLPVSTLTVNGVALASSPLVSPTLYRYDTSSGTYAALSPSTDALQPYAGYWLYARQPVTLMFPPPTP